MNGVYYTIYNNIRDRDAGVKPVSRPNIPTAEQEYDEIKVPGRDGNLYRKSPVWLIRLYNGQYYRSLSLF